MEEMTTYHGVIQKWYDLQLCLMDEIIIRMG